MACFLFGNITNYIVLVNKFLISQIFNQREVKVLRKRTRARMRMIHMLDLELRRLPLHSKQKIWPTMKGSRYHRLSLLLTGPD
jgi:hypothetical protein